MLQRQLGRVVRTTAAGVIVAAATLACAAHAETVVLEHFTLIDGTDALLLPISR